MTRFTFVLLALFTISSCSNADESIENEEGNEEETINEQPNILLVIADDIGLDATPGYNIGNIKPNMPNLQSIMNSGITFNNVWSNPTCSPTRAGILTGKYGFRTGVVQAGNTLSSSEISLQNYLDTSTNSAYNHAVIGKWHLSRTATHPNDMGINYYAGFSTGGGVPSYYDWDLTINGTTSNSTEYTTTKFTDLAIDWIDDQTQPWFLWLAYNAPHTPFHLPPNNLHNQGDLQSDQSSIDLNPLPYYMAALEAMDSELGRLLASMSDAERENTIIIFIGDNGTPNQVAQAYPNRSVKGTIYQGGVNVPMAISGKGVTRINDTEDALINTLDLFATIADIAGSGTTEINDSKSFKALLSDSGSIKRDYVFTEQFDVTIRSETHKYILFDDGFEGLYNLTDEYYETTNLLDSNLSPTDETIKTELYSELQEIIN